MKDNQITSEEPKYIEGERTIPSVNKGLGVQARVTNFILFATVILFGCFVLWKYYAYQIHKRAETQAASGHDNKSQISTTSLPHLVTPTLSEPSPTVKSEVAPTAIAPVTNNQITNNLGPDGKPILSPEEQIRERRLHSPVFFKAAHSDNSGGGSASRASNAHADGNLTGNSGGNGLSGGSDPLSKSLESTHEASASAYTLSDPNLTITKTTVIPCTIEPALNTSLPGIVSCFQKADVYGANGKVLLLERGTKWTGEMKSSLSQGQNRAAILWTRGETPEGVLIDVDSPAADQLGRTGIEGEVDNHFADRFGAAIMLSVINDLGAFLVATQQNNSSGNNNTTVAFPNTVSGTQNVMGDVLKQTLNIAPTLTKNQGADVIIYVARDLNFNSVYDLKVK